ncbi:23S rRNA (pseudouridine(1915)-N(3))-methyltransferase RlmH [Candidatus Saccharibacteria bacterium]|nr:23S rRNA (pseudouridine(1915)-N(3))-methyltransferase RlmH [Candidatus Saccharibacteria bacterium]
MKIIVGGKKHISWAEEAIREYEKRLVKPYKLEWEYVEEEKLNKKLSDWPFTGHDFVIVCDERGKNISSEAYSKLLQEAFLNSKNVVILIGGAYGFSEEVRAKADFIWSFSDLVFPHMLARTIVAEQTYRAQEISKGSHYHHA